MICETFSQHIENPLTGSDGFSSKMLGPDHDFGHSLNSFGAWDISGFFVNVFLINLLSRVLLWSSVYFYMQHLSLLVAHTGAIEAPVHLLLKQARSIYEMRSRELRQTAHEASMSSQEPSHRWPCRRYHFLRAA